MSLPNKLQDHLQPDMLVSVVIPLFNACDVIGETLASVFSQTWKACEVIVVDDGSTDQSKDVVASFGSKVRYIWQENQGVAAARNHGIQASRGKYIAFLDHDDLWDPTKLEKQVRVLEERDDIGLVISDVVHVDRDGKVLGRPESPYRPDDDFARLFVKNYLPTPSAAMIRSVVLDKIGGFDQRFRSAGLDDHEFWTRVADYCEIANIAEPLTYHRNLVGKAPEIQLSHREVLLSRLMNRYGGHLEKRRYLERERASALSDLGKHYLLTGHKREGQKHLIRAIIASISIEGWNAKIACRSSARLLRSIFH